MSEAAVEEFEMASWSMNMASRADGVAESNSELLIPDGDNSVVITACGFLSLDYLRVFDLTGSPRRVAIDASYLANV